MKQILTVDTNSAHLCRKYTREGIIHHETSMSNEDIDATTEGGRAPQEPSIDTMQQDVEEPQPPPPSLNAVVEGLLECPISLERMRDPVMLTKSGVTYDREHLCRALLEFPNKDPNNTEYDEPLEYVPNYTARALLTQVHGEAAFVEFDDSNFQESEYDEAWDSVMLRALEGTVNEEGQHQVIISFKTVQLLAERGYAHAQFLLAVAYARPP